jgi:hypothetical protein
MSEAVICDHCGKILRRHEALELAQIATPTEHYYGGHLCPTCQDNYELYPDPDGWGWAAKPKKEGGSDEH